MSEIPRPTRQRLRAVVEVSVVLLVFVLLGRWLRAVGFFAWQESVLGSRAASNTLLFFVLPALVLAATGRSFASYGLATRRLGYHLAIGGAVGGILLPATMLFPVVMLRQWSPMEWKGAGVLTAGFGLAGLIALAVVARRPNEEAARPSASGRIFFVSVLVAGLVASSLLARVSPVATRFLYVLLFVAVLEEFFFRGYLQGRLNGVFDRPWSLFGTNFGIGLATSAVLFGLFHPIMSAQGLPWPWALWTGAVGFVFGLMREKTGAILASSLAHGIILLPQVLFGS